MAVFIDIASEMNAFEYREIHNFRGRKNELFFCTAISVNIQIHPTKIIWSPIAFSQAFNTRISFVISRMQHDCMTLLCGVDLQSTHMDIPYYTLHISHRWEKATGVAVVITFRAYLTFPIELSYTHTQSV